MEHRHIVSSPLTRYWRAHTWSMLERLAKSLFCKNAATGNTERNTKATMESHADHLSLSLSRLWILSYSQLLIFERTTESISMIYYTAQHNTAGSGMEWGKLVMSSIVQGVKKAGTEQRGRLKWSALMKWSRSGSRPHRWAQTHVGHTYLIGWGWGISRTHCTWNTGDGNTDFRRNPHLQDRKYDLKIKEDEVRRSIPDLFQTGRTMLRTELWLAYWYSLHEFW